MILKVLLLLSITTVCFAKPSISYGDELSILTELKAENVISQQRFDILLNNIQYKKPIKTLKTLGGTAAINGYVENASGLALELQNIRLHEIVAGEQVEVSITTTDASGNFSFTGLHVGTYVVYYSQFNDVYINYMWDSATNVICTVYFGACRTPGITNHIVLADAEIRNGIDFTPEVGGVINGSVTDSIDNTGIGTVSIRLVRPDSSSDYSFYADLDAVTGVFSVRGIPDGDYRIYTVNSLANNNIHIPRIYGGPECNACNRLMWTEPGVGTTLTINSANTINNIDFSLNVGASITGNLVDSITLGSLPNSAWISLFNDLNQYLGFQIIQGTDTNSTADGSYFLGGLIPGNYYVQGDGRGYYQRQLFSNRPCYWGGCNRSLGDLVSLSPLENLVDVDFLLETGGLISGTVTDQITGLPIIETEGFLTRTRIEVIAASGEVIGGANVADDGTYTTARGLPAGNYSVRTGSMFQGQLTSPYVNEKYNDIPCAGVACDLSVPNVTVVNDVTTPGIDFALTTGNSFTGTVTDITTSAPIGGVHILVYRDMGMGVVGFANWATTSRGEPGDPPIGAFEVSGLPDGTYFARTGYGSDLPFFVSVFANIGGPAPVGWIDILYDNMPCLAGCDITLGTPIVLPAVTKSSTKSSSGGTTVNFTLNQGATISGTALDFINQAPLGEVTINVYNDQGTFMGSSITNTNGEYITRGLPVGSYYLTTSSYDALLDIKYGNDFCFVGSCNPLDAQVITVSELENKTDQNFVLKTAFMHIFNNGFE